MSRRFAKTILLSTLLCRLVANAGGPPELTGIFPLGAQRGTHQSVTLFGKGLVPGPDTAVEPGSNFPGKATLVEAKSSQATIQISLNSDAPIGIYSLRMRTRDGLSGKIYFAVGLYRDVKVDPAVANSQGQAVEPGVTLNGEIEPAQQHAFVVHMKSNQRLVAEVEASRLRVDIDPVLEVIGPAGHKLAWNDDSLGLGSDARVEFVARSAGPHRIVIHDATYQKRGGYRLKIGDYQYAVGVVPPGGESSSQVAFVGGSANPPIVASNSSGKQPGDWLWDMVDQPFKNSAALPLHFELHPDAAVTPGEMRGTPDKDPVVYYGVIDAKESARKFTVQVRPGFRYTAIVERTRPVSRLSPQVVVRGTADAVLAQVDGEGDQPLRINFATPAGCKSVIIAIGDAMDRHGLETGFSLSVAREIPSFDVYIENPTLNIPRNGAEIVRLRAVRNGYAGPIQVQLREWLNDSTVEVTGGLIPRDQTEGFLAIVAKPNAEKSIPAFALRALGGPSAQPLEVRVRPDPKLANVHAMDGGTAEEVAAAVCRERPISVQSKVRTVTVLHGLPAEVKFDVVRTAEAKAAEIDLRIEGLREFRDELKELKIPKDQSTALLKIPARSNLPVAKRLLVLQGNATIGGEVWPVKVQPIVLDFQRPYSLEVLTPEVRVAKSGKTVVEGLIRRTAPFAGEVEIRVEDLPRGLTAEPLKLSGDRAIVQLPVTATDAADGVYSVRLTAATAMGGAKRTKDYVIPPVGLTIRVGSTAMKPADMPTKKAKAKTAKKPAAKKEA